MVLLLDHQARLEIKKREVMNMNRIILMKVLGQATADHTTAKEQALVAGDMATVYEEEKAIETILSLVGYILQHPDFGDYK